MGGVAVDRALRVMLPVGAQPGKRIPEDVFEPVHMIPRKPAAVSARVAVVRALWDLGGADRSVDTEDVAIRGHELLPGAFSWRKYRQYVNPERARVALVHAALEGLVTGNARSGWRLTEAGERLAKDEGARLAPLDGRAPRKDPLADRIAMSAAVRAARTGGVESVTFRDAERLFGLNGYVTDRSLRRSAMARVLEAVRHEPDLHALVSSIADRFRKELEVGRR